MTLPVPPLTLYKYARVLWFIGNAADVLRPHLFDYWQGLINGADLKWVRYVTRCEDQISQDPADDAYFKIDVVNYTGGSIDQTWTDADLDSVATKISDELIFNYRDYMQPSKRFTELKAYSMQFNDLPPPGVEDPLEEKAFADSGPPLEIWPLSYTGNGTGFQAPQVASSVTLMTPLRRHWGRFYLPWPAGSYVEQSGQFNGTAVAAICGHVDALAQQLADSEFYMVVPSTQEKKAPLYALQSVTGVRVDSVFDIIRRRRTETAASKVTHDIATPGTLPA